MTGVGIDGEARVPICAVCGKDIKVGDEAILKGEVGEGAYLIHEGCEPVGVKTLDEF